MMRIRVRVKHGALVVRAAGELTSPAAEELFEQVKQELAPAPRDIVLDLTDVQSIAAGALPYVFRLQKHAQDAENRLFVAGAPEPVRRLFEKTRVHDSLKLVASEDEAFQATVS